MLLTNDKNIKLVYPKEKAERRMIKMSNGIQNVTHAAQRKMVEKIMDTALSKISSEREESFLKILDLAESFLGDSMTQEQYDNIKTVIKNPDNRWVQFANKMLDETNPHVAKMAALNLGYEAAFRGTKQIRRNRVKYQCSIPWLILFDPTSACNMHCAGCWSGTYGHKHNLSYEDMNQIIRQGKELGIYLYMMTGGEPLVRKKDILRLAEEHNDVELSIYTNSILIDEEFCKEVVRLGNITFQLSIEGTPETNDKRRGEGHYSAVMAAMDLLRRYGILFGTSICYTRNNIEAVTSDEFIRMIADKGARFGFFFHYMPVGNNAVPELIPTMEQRKKMIARIRHIRSDKCDIPFFPMDFQNDGEFVGGCIAGGRNYFHINSAGDAEPCVFVHYSNANIHDSSILEILQSPLFMEYRKGQPFSRNHLRPCPMLENPKILQEMVHKTNARSTDLESPETVEHLCAKCTEYAANWEPVADEIWNEKEHTVLKYQNYSGN